MQDKAWLLLRGIFEPHNPILKPGNLMWGKGNEVRDRLNTKKSAKSNRLYINDRHSLWVGKWKPLWKHLKRLQTFILSNGGLYKRLLQNNPKLPWSMASVCFPDGFLFLRDSIPCEWKANTILRFQREIHPPVYAKPLRLHERIVANCQPSFRYSLQNKWGTLENSFSNFLVCAKKRKNANGHDRTVV